MTKQLIAARLMAYFKAASPKTLHEAAEYLGESISSIQKCAYKLRDKSLLVETGEKVKMHKLPCKVWRITEKGKSADPANPLRSKAAIYGRTTKWLSEQVDRNERRRAAEYEEAKRRASNVCKVDPDMSKATVEEIHHFDARRHAEQTMQKFFSAHKPGVYVLEPASCSARAYA